MDKRDMSVKGLRGTLHIAPKLDQLLDSEGVEIPHSLPPGDSVQVHAVDEYPGCPSNWMNGSDIASSYFLAVKKEKGMWLNFNNCVSHTHDVAVVVSIQGVNPITGQKMVGSKALKLEQYKTKCPIHDVKFQQDLFCPECKFKWPDQNYIATTGTPVGSFWIDGFRNPDGTVRQYIFTEEEMKGVASQMIGDDRVFAIGIAFYLSKEAKPQPTRSTPTRSGYKACMSPHYDNPPAYMGYKQSDGGDIPMKYTHQVTNSSKTGWNIKCCLGGPAAASSAGSEGEPIGIILPDSVSVELERAASCADTSDMYEMHSLESCDSDGDMLLSIDSLSIDDSIDEISEPASSATEPVKEVKKLEVGAGALIAQEIHADPKDMDYWEDTPVGMIYINYSDKDTVDRITAKGKRQESKEGFLEGLEVGTETK